MKQIVAPSGKLAVIAFRVRKSAASLKLGIFFQPTRATCFFPRSKERGLIEATRLVECPSSKDRFPRSKERGLIEADIAAYDTLQNERFPRSKERGLIEA